MKMTDIQNNKFYLLDRSPLNPNNADERVLELRVVNENDTQVVVAEDEIETVRFALTPDLFEQNAAGPMFFVTREDAEAQYQEELAVRAETIRNISKDGILFELFHEWCNSGVTPEHIVREAMAQKIKDEFGVDVTA